MLVLGFAFFVFLNVIAVGADYANNPFLSNGPLNIASPGTLNPQLPGAILLPVRPEQSTIIPPTYTPISINKNCPKARGQFPATACNKFINCWDGIAIEQECNPGLLFNPKGFCDYPFNVDCNGKPIVTTSPPPVTSPGPYPTDGSWWNPSSIPASATPSTPSPVTATTPAAVTSIFSTQSSSSSSTTYKPYLPPSSTQGSWLIPALVTQQPSLPSDPLLKKRCLKPRGQFPSASCNTYINCWDDTVLEQECPQGLLFSTQGYCDYAANVNCEGRTIPEYVPKNPEVLPVKPIIITEKPVVIPGLPTVIPSECPKPSGTFRNKTRCSGYFTCIDNKVVVSSECAGGLLFNDKYGVCDYERNVDCSKEYIKEEVVTTTQAPVYNRECHEEFGTFRDKNNCSVYYICAHRKVAAEYVCPPGFKFNDNIGVCDYEERVNCNQASQSFRRFDVAPTISAENMRLIKSCNPGEVLRLDPLCNKAARCREDKAEIIHCPQGLAYDSVFDKCISQHLARC